MIEDLYPAWLARDWEAWARALPEVARKAASYREDAKRFEADDVLVVAFGETGAAGLMERLFRRKSSVEPAAWCPDRYEGAVQ